MFLFLNDSEGIPKEIGFLKNLRGLDISSNELTKLPGSLPKRVMGGATFYLKLIFLTRRKREHCLCKHRPNARIFSGPG